MTTKPTLILTGSIAALVFLSINPLITAAEPSNKKAEQELPETVITATSASPYSAEAATSVTKTSMPLNETPVSVQVIGEQVIKDRNITAPKQLAEVTAGVQPVVGYGSTPSQLFLIRGFFSSGLNYWNGFRLRETYTPHDFANVDRVEFVKGPSLLFGAGQPGGAVNTVTKRPQQGSFLEITQSVGSFDQYRTTVDTNTQLGPISLRLNAAANTGDSALDFFRERNAFIAPVLEWQISKDTKVLYELEYQRYKADGWSNGLPNSSKVLGLAFGATASSASSKFLNERNAHHLELTHSFTEGLSVRQGLYFDRSNRSYLVAQPYWGSTDTVFDRMTFYSPHEGSRNLISQTEVFGNFETGDLKHSVVAGFEASQNIWEYQLASGDQYDAGGNFTGTDLGSFDLFHPDYSKSPQALPTSFAEKNTTQAVAFYVQDSVSLGKWRLLGGMRGDQFKTDKENLLDGSKQSQTDGALTARGGLMYLIRPETSAFYSISQSFTPNLGRSVDGGQFKPEHGLQNEIGIKHALRKGLELTTSLYQIKKENVLTTDPANNAYSITAGEQRSRGVEACLAGQVTSGFRIISNATLQKAEVTKSNSVPVGTKLYGVPEKSGNLWGVYDLPTPFPGQLSIGAGVVYVGEREATEPNGDFKLPGYTRIDSGLFYKVRNVNVALQVQNLNNRKYLDTIEGSGVQIQAPRSVTLTVGVRF